MVNSNAIRKKAFSPNRAHHIPSENILYVMLTSKPNGKIFSEGVKTRKWREFFFVLARHVLKLFIIRPLPGCGTTCREPFPCK